MTARHVFAVKLEAGSVSEIETDLLLAAHPDQRYLTSPKPDHRRFRR